VSTIGADKKDDASESGPQKDTVTRLTTVIAQINTAQTELKSLARQFIDEIDE